MFRTEHTGQDEALHSSSTCRVPVLCEISGPHRMCEGRDSWLVIVDPRVAEVAEIEDMLLTRVKRNETALGVRRRGVQGG